MTSLRQPPAASPVLSPKTLTAVEPAFDRDLGHDSDLNRAAVTLIGITGFAVVAVAAAWLMLRDGGPMTVRVAEPLLGGSFEHENAAIAADTPVLRPGLPVDDGPGPGAFTLMDAATGLREVVEVTPHGTATTLAR